MYTCENGFSCNFKQTIDFLKNELGLSQTSISVNKKDTDNKNKDVIRL